MVSFHCLPQAKVGSVQWALVVAQSASAPPAVLQSELLVAIGKPLQPPAFGSGLSLESMQPPSPESGPLAAAAHWNAWIRLTPPPFVNSDTTSTSLFWCWPTKFAAPVAGEVQLAGPCNSQTPTSLLPLFLFFSSPK